MILAFLLVFHIIKEPCDAVTSRAQVNPFYPKEPTMALYRISESRLVPRAIKSGASKNVRVADFLCTFCGCTVEKCVSNATRCQSCGCAKSALITQKNSGDRQRFMREYRIWQNMKNRCTRPANHNFSHYGGRGISVCERWLSSFANFINDMGACPVSFSIDRIDSNGNYEPSNCRWSPPSIQSKNRRVANIIKVGEETKNLCEWLLDDRTVSKTQFYRNIRLGLNPETALFYRCENG
jgi:hypothetical protein